MRKQMRTTGATQPSREDRPVLIPAGEAEGNMVIRVPMKLKRDHGRKQVVAPSGLEGPVVFSRGQAQQALVLALARAHRWSRMLERGEVASVNELAEQQGVDPSLIGRTLRLGHPGPRHHPSHPRRPRALRALNTKVVQGRTGMLGRATTQIQLLRFSPYWIRMEPIVTPYA